MYKIHRQKFWALEKYVWYTTILQISGNPISQKDRKDPKILFIRLRHWQYEYIHLEVFQ